MLTNLVVLKNPFNLRDRDVKRIEIENECGLDIYLEKYAPIPADMEYHASINGRVYKPEEIPLHVVRGYDSVVVCPVLRGGRSGSNPLAILAGIALMIVSFGFVAPLVGGLFGGGVLGSIAGSVAAGLTMMIGGQLISNAFSPSLKSSNPEVDEASYGWGTLQSITQQGAVIPITYGTIRTAGQILNQHVRIESATGVESRKGDEYLYMLLSGGEGPIDSFSDFRINDNPAENYGVTPETRSGVNTQTWIPGHEYTYSSQAVQVIMDTASGQRRNPGEWHTVDFVGDSADSIEITVNFPKGLAAYSTSSPDLIENWVSLEFQYRIQSKSGSWGEWISLTNNYWVDDKAHGWNPERKTTSPFSELLREKVSFSSELHEKLQVRGRVFAKNWPDSMASQCVDTVQWTSLTGMVLSGLTHPNKALVGVRIKATDQLNGGMPTITWKQTRNHVLVYDGGWGEKDAQNPAWIIYDLIVHARSLDGTVHVFGENPSRIDLAAFKAWAAWNDRTLNNRPALKMNLLVNESKSLWEWCNDIAASARGAVVLKGTKISCIFDAPSDPVQLFSMGNIIAGSFSGEFLSIEERANAVEIAFNNEANNFEREQITVYSEGFDDSDSRANPVSVQLTGITDFERAYREGVYRLNQNKYLLRTITFTADVDAIACQVGDVILVQHDIPQWGQGGRILAIDGLVLTLDNDVIFNPDKAYAMIIRKQNDERVQFYVTGTGTTNTVTVTGSPNHSITDLSDLSPYDVFTLGQINKEAKPFRVQEMSRTGDLQVTLTCTEYIAEVYTDATNIPVIQYSDTSTSGIIGLQIVSSGYYTTSGQWVSEIWAYWSYIGERPAMYEVQWSYDNGVWQNSVKLTANQAQCAIQNRNTVYRVRVRALYVSGLPSQWSYAVGEGLSFAPSIRPDAPTNLQATGWFGYASLTWNNPSNIDFSYVEVWEATEDDITKAVNIGGTPADSYTRLLPAGGAFWYWVRAVNLTGLKSDFNSLAGTPCVISAESHEAYVTQLLEDNPYLQESLDDLSERIEPLELEVPQIRIDVDDIIDVQIPQLENEIVDIEDITIPNIQSAIENINNIEIPQLQNDIVNINEIEIPQLQNEVEDIQDVQIPQLENEIININEIEIPQLQNDIADINDIKIPALTGKVTDNQNYIHQNIFPALSRVGEGLLRLGDETARTRNVFRWAGIEVNEEEGTVIIRGLEDLKTATGYQFSTVEQRLDAQAADINLKANRAYVDELAASLISSVIVAQEWKFQGSLNGWTGQNAILTAQPDGIKYAIAASSPSMTSPDIAINGAVNNIIGLQLQQISGNSNFTVRIQYKTSEHGYSDSYMKRVEILGSVNVVRSIQVDMHALSFGGNDWKNSVITGIRILIDDTVNAEYLIPLVNIGYSTMSELIIAGIEARITQAEADIDGANAAISLKADETTVSAISQRLSRAEIDIDGLQSAITLKADKTELTTTNTRVQSAEVRIDALEGTISQEVSDIKILQEQINANSEAILQGAVNDAEESSTRRLAIAQAKQELHAEITETNEAIAQAKLDLIAAIGENTAAIQEEQTARATADEAEAQARQTLSTQVNANQAAIETIRKTYADDKTAEAYTQRVIQAQLKELSDSALQTAVNDAEGQAESRRAVAQVREELYANIDDVNKASAGYRLELLTLINENDAQYQEDIQAITTDLNAEVSARETLAVQVGQNTSGLQTEATTRATADSALSGRIDTVAAGVAENKSAIQTEAQVRAAADEAEAQARQTLSTQVEANKSAVETIQKTYADDKTAEAYTQRVIQAQLKELSDSALQTAVNDAEGQAESRRAVAQVREELYANIEETNKASAGYRLELLTLINENDAQYQEDIQAITTDLNAEVSARETLAVQVGQNTSGLQTEATTRANADSALSGRIDTVAAGVAENKSAIQTEAQVRAAADEAEAQARQTLTAQVEANRAAIQTEATIRANDTNALAGRVDTVAAGVGENQSAIQSETQARIQADDALASGITVVQANVDINAAAIRTEATARAAADSAEAQARQTLTSQVEANRAAIQTIENTRADDKTAEAYTQRVIQAQLKELSDSALQNAVNDAEGQEQSRKAVAQVREELYANIEETNKASAGYRLELLTLINNNDAQYQNDIQALSTDLAAEVTARETLAVQVGQNTSGLQTEATIRANDTNALAGRIDTVAAGVGENQSAIQSETQARIQADDALASGITVVQANVDINAAAIRTETTARATADEALSSRITTLQATVGQNTSAIQSEAQTRAAADSAEAQARQTLTSQVEANRAAIQTIENTRADDKTAEAYTQRVIQAQLKELSDSALQNAVNDAEGQAESRRAVAQVREELYANIDDANKASAGYRLELLTAIDENDAKYQNEISAVTTNLNAEISARQTLQSTVSGHTTSIQTLNDVKDGIVGKHLLKVDANGYVAGYELYNGGDSKSSFTVAADKFLISRPGVKDPKQLFVYDSAAGSLAIQNLIVDGANIKNATIVNAKIEDATITRLKIGNDEISRIAVSYSNAQIDYKWPLVGAASIGGALGPVGAEIPDGLLLAYETEVGAKYYFNSCFTINYIYNYDYATPVATGICYSYIRVNPGDGTYTTLAGPYKRIITLFDTARNPLTIPFSAKFTASTSGIAYYAVLIGFYYGDNYFINTRGENNKTIGINIGPTYLNAITLFR